MASVVISRPATEAASCRAVRTTLAGSMTPAFDHVAIFAGLGVVAEVGEFFFSRILPTTIEPSTPAFSAIWRTGACSARRTMLMPAFWSSLSPLSLLSAEAQQGDAAAGDDAFFNGSAGGVQRVVNAVLLFLHFDFGRAADADDRNAAGQLGQTFLQLLLVVVRGGLLDLGA
jgi:hypothetical protein